VLLLISSVHPARYRRFNRWSLCAFCGRSGQLHRHCVWICRFIRCSVVGWTDAFQTWASDQPVFDCLQCRLSIIGL